MFRAPDDSHDDDDDNNDLDYDVDDYDDVVDDLPEEQGRAEVQFRGLVEPAPDSEFLAPKRKHCCSLAVGVSIFENISFQKKAFLLLPVGGQVLDVWSLKAFCLSSSEIT